MSLSKATVIFRVSESPAFPAFRGCLSATLLAMGVKTRIIYGALATMTIILSMGENTMAQTKSTTVVKNIVLVHGGSPQADQACHHSRAHRRCTARQDCL